MKRIIVFIVLGLGLTTTAQDASVERSIFGVQTGYLGVWAHNELKILDELVIRTELGFDAGLFGDSVNGIDEFLLTPVLSLEPKWYYNLKKRANASKDIKGNSANFISLKVGHHPDWFVISSNSGTNIKKDISVVPTWGIRRNLGANFNYELGAGVGYFHYLQEDKGDVALNLHVRIGLKL